MSNDPDDEKPVEPCRTFTFRGKPLAGFSWSTRATLYRIMSERTPVMEEYTYLIYLLLTKKPAQMDALRSEESLAAFRIEAGEWAEREKLGDGQGWEDLKSAAHAVLGETKKAESLEPTPSKGRKKRVGN